MRFLRQKHVHVYQWVKQRVAEQQSFVIRRPHTWLKNKKA